MISLNDIHVTFNPGTPLAKPALLGINLDIAAGEFITVIGSNGAGKSTLLNIISGDISCDRGRIAVGTDDVTAWSTARRATLVSRVFQNPLAGSCAELTIEENLVLAFRRGKLRGMRPALNNRLRDQFRARLASLDLGLENRLCDRIGLLSGGQRQALSLVMATLAPATILLLDEHTAALDPKTAHFIMKLTEQLVTEHNLTTLMVTHSMRQALTVGNRLLMLHEGRVVYDASASEKAHLSVNDLLNRFASDGLSDDSLLLS
ncbi:ABC transporter ATP-binding protein [Leptolyngbyaceae cyanobacterium CCMR0082]|uniref:ABC transporter ATP-binding protein n=2 Tax=Adonisia turfae TaxID=2950184 RepID=A0A6M0SI53_9CYAN|nr:ABC transporter ATP-binding protein [Adonisia turfae]MDV3348046.1 ABC transporter ATP-binding protein [Leptothoe sp. LEGE 181152]NEZ58164.1 ATP-binding cassette domain-containing protein [Adonisia turfae CCMR0081]NEZ68197.1 ABC transporter ATP-binding protein [Adonisia turfae CCMR0082]